MRADGAGWPVRSSVTESLKRFVDDGLDLRQQIRAIQNGGRQQQRLAVAKMPVTQRIIQWRRDNLFRRLLDCGNCLLAGLRISEI